MKYTIKLLNKTITENVKISEHFHGRMVTISFEVIGENDFYYNASIKIPNVDFTKAKAKKLILANIKKYIVDKKKLQMEKAAFQEEYEIEL